MEYKLVMERKPTHLEAEVKRLIGEGWAPIGGVAIAITETPDYLYHSFAQAMIRDRDAGPHHSRSSTPAELDRDGDLVTPAPGPLIDRGAGFKGRVLDFRPDRETGMVWIHLDAIAKDADEFELLVQHLRQMIMVVDPLAIFLVRSSTPAEHDPGV